MDVVIDLQRLHDAGKYTSCQVVDVITRTIAITGCQLIFFYHCWISPEKFLKKIKRAEQNLSRNKDPMINRNVVRVQFL